MNQNNNIGAATLLAFITCVSLKTSVAEAKSHHCKLNPQTSTFLVHTQTEGLLSALAHKRTIEATQFSGTIIYNEEDLTKSRVELLIETQGLSPADKTLSKGDREKITENMRDSIMADTFPTMHFGSQTVVPNSKGIRVAGDLRMKGNARRISLDVALEKINNELRSSGEFKVRQTDFGIQPYSALLGTIRVADELRFEFRSSCTLPQKEPAVVIAKQPN